jgi:hypothetical protein
MTFLHNNFNFNIKWQYTLEDYFDKIEKLVINFKFFLRSVKNKSEKMKKIEKFFDALITCSREVNKIKNDQYKDRGELLSVLYESEVLKSIAIGEGFHLEPVRPLIDKQLNSI